MATREDIATIVADANGDKDGRITRLRAQRLLDRLTGNLPFIWTPRAQVSVIVKQVSLNGNAIEFVIDLTIHGVTKSLSMWVEGKHSVPDWRIVNPPLFVDDLAGDVTFQMDDGTTRRGRDDFIIALKQVFIDIFGARIAP